MLIFSYLVDCCVVCETDKIGSEQFGRFDPIKEYLGNNRKTGWLGGPPCIMHSSPPVIHHSHHPARGIFYNKQFSLHT